MYYSLEVTCTTLHLTHKTSVWPWPVSGCYQSSNSQILSEFGVMLNIQWSVWENCTQSTNLYKIHKFVWSCQADKNMKMMNSTVHVALHG